VTTPSPRAGRAARKKKATTLNSSAQYALRVLRLISISDELLRAADISRRLDITLSNTRRALSTLVQSGYLQRHPHWGRYESGFTSQQLLYAALDRFPIRTVGLPYLRQLAFYVHGTASLNVRLGWYSVRIASVSGGGSFFTHARRLGEPEPLHASGAGRAMLALLGEESLIECLRFHNRTHGPSANERTALQKALAAIRKSGFVLERDAPAKDVNALSIAVRNPAGAAIASVLIDGVSERVPPLNHGPQFDVLMEIVRTFEKHGRENPTSFNGPFDHLPPGQIRFGVD